MKFRHNVAERFYNDCMNDEMPSSPAVLVDFFPTPPVSQGDIFAYYWAYSQGIRSGKITAEELDNAICKGIELSKLVQRIVPKIPVFTTSYDLIF